MEEQIQVTTTKVKTTTEKPELMVGFWFVIGVILAVKMVNSLEYCIDELISKKSGYCQ